MITEPCDIKETQPIRMRPVTIDSQSMSEAKVWGKSGAQVQSINLLLLGPSTAKLVCCHLPVDLTHLHACFPTVTLSLTESMTTESHRSIIMLSVFFLISLHTLIYYLTSLVCSYFFNIILWEINL